MNTAHKVTTDARRLHHQTPSISNSDGALIRLNTPGVSLIVAAVQSCYEFHCRLHRLVTHESFQGSHRKKSRLDKSGGREGHGFRAARTVHRCRKDLFNCSRTTNQKSGSTASYLNHMLRLTLAGTSSRKSERTCYRKIR